METESSGGLIALLSTSVGTTQPAIRLLISVLTGKFIYDFLLSRE